MKTLLKLALFLLVSTFLLTTWADESNSSELLSASDIKQYVTDINRVLASEYQDKAKLDLIASALAHKFVINTAIEYSSANEFARDAAIVLRNITSDAYIELASATPSISLSTSQSSNSKAPDYGIANVDILDNNIGVLKLNYFSLDPQALPALREVFENLKDTDALIVDLTDAEGQSVPVAQYLLSYLLPEQTELAKVSVVASTTQALHAIPTIDLPIDSRFVTNKPLYVLTSAFTSPTGEFIAYALKHFDKALIVGEPTMGIATMTQTFKLNDKLNLTLPYAHFQHPVTKANWSDSGVTPDHNVSASFSLEYTLTLANDYLHQQSAMQ